MKGAIGTRVLLLHPAAFAKQPSGGGGVVAGGAALFAAPHRLWLLALVSFFTFASLLTLFTTTTTTNTNAHGSVGPTRGGGSLDGYATDVLEASLLHYAATSSNASGGMPEPDLRRIASLVRRRAPCNLLVFGLGHESLLWRALNRGGRTVFLDESEYRVSRFEERHTGAVRLEAYDVAYTTRVGELRDLLASARERRIGDCRAVQNLLFSDCRLAINDLPNHIYDIAWDVVLVDGPRGYTPESPGRMAAIFTAGVLARSAAAGGEEGMVDVLVHDFEREAERMCSDEFLCTENLVESTGQLAHFQIRRRGPRDEAFEFCDDRNASFPYGGTTASSTLSTSSPSLAASAR